MQNKYNALREDYSNVSLQQMAARHKYDDDGQTQAAASVSADLVREIQQLKDLLRR